MEYKVLENLVNVKLENFITEYKNTSKLFENEDVQNGLLHAGEYGMYKEKLLTKLFEFTLPKKYTCGTGFIINSQKEITTQCDIILFDVQNAPFLEIDSGRFFPQEVVYGIGEIKSKLSKKDLIDALIKLAKIKQIRNPFSGIAADGSLVDVNPLIEQYHSLCTFLICDEVKGWDKSFVKDITKAYEENNIDIQYRFNIILSLKNGVLAYDIHNVDIAAKIVADMKGVSYKEIGEHASIATPFFKSPGDGITPLKYFLIEKSTEVENLKEFLVLLNNFIQDLKSYYPEPTHYLYNE